MSATRRALVAVTAGTVFSRLVGMGAALFLARAAGLVALGEYATAVQVGVILALVCHTGIASVAAREAAHSPADAPTWLRASVRARLATSLAAFAAAWIASAWIPGDRTLLLVAAASVIPAAFDLKWLADATGHAPVEVGLETLAGAVQLVSLVALAATGALTPLTAAAAWVAGRAAYATAAVVWLRSLAASTTRPSIRRLVFVSGGPLSIAQAADRLTLASDVVLLRLLAGPGPAGLYAAAEKVSMAAGFALAQVSRVLHPHVLRAAAHGDARRALETGLRTCAYAVLPFAAGGWVVADSLLAALYGPEFAAGGWALRWALLAVALAAVWFRFPEMLFALRRTRASVAPSLTGTVVNWVASVLLIPAYGAAGSAFGTVVAHGVATPVGWVLLRREMKFDVLRPLLPPVLLSAAVAGAAAAGSAVGGLLGALACGAAAFALGIWRLELRRGWASLGTGLEAASARSPGS